MITFDATLDPDATLDYTWDWSAWLSGGETITAVEWIVPDGIDQPTDPLLQPSHDDTTATIWLTGGTLGEDYELTCRITTSAGRVDDRSKTIICRER